MRHAGLLIATSAISTWQAIRASAAKAAADRNLTLAVAAVDQFCTKVSEDRRLKEFDLRPLRRDLLKSAVDFQQQLLELRGSTDLAHIDLARSYVKLANLTREIDAHHRSIELYFRAVDEFEHLLKNQSVQSPVVIEFAQCLTDLSHVLTDTGRTNEATAMLDRSVKSLTAVIGEQPDQINARYELARVLELGTFVKLMTRQFEESKSFAQQAIGQWKILRANHPEKINYGSHEAYCRYRLGETLVARSISNWQAAESEMLAALTIQRNLMTRPDVGVYERKVLAQILRGLGRISKISQRLDVAMQYLRESESVFAKLRKEEPSFFAHAAELAGVYQEMAGCQSLAGLQAQSEAFNQQAADILDELAERDPGNILWETRLAEVLSLLGDAAGQSGNTEKALQNYDRSIHLLDVVLRREPQSRNANDFLPDILRSRGLLLAGMGQVDAALEDLNRAVAMTSGEMSDRFRLSRAGIIARQGDYQQAAEETRQSLENLAQRCDPHFMVALYLRGAAVYATCAEMAKVDLKLDQAEADNAFDKYAKIAIATLQSAVDSGLSDRTPLAESTDFAAIRDHPDFVTLVK